MASCLFPTPAFVPRVHPSYRLQSRQLTLVIQSRDNVTQHSIDVLVRLRFGQDGISITAERLGQSHGDGWATTHALLAMANVIATPHSAGSSSNSRVAAPTQLGQETARILTGRWPMSLVNPEVRADISVRQVALNQP